jgi:aminopeptidase N
LAGQEALNATAQALELYAARFAPYPHRQLTSVEAEFADGMEYDGLYFLGREYYAAYNGEPTGYLSMLSAHETAHQWWYGLVGNDPALDPFLDEAFATYSELLFYEHYYPHLVDWWWQYRVQRFAPAGCVNSTIYDHTGFRSYVNAVYLRGALMLHDLRQEMGEDQFAAFLRNYSTDNRAAIASEEAFHRSLIVHFDGDPRDLLQPYCLRNHVAPP